MRSAARKGPLRKPPAATGPQANGNGGAAAAAAELQGAAAERPVLITGGAGFIGTNLAHRLLSQGRSVILFDTLCRSGVERNLAWLQAQHGLRVRHEWGDIRDPEALRSVVRVASQVFHFAAQVAVTTSLEEPLEDFDINARGTLNLLEALRSLPNPPPLLFTSTNKVYGELQGVKLRLRQGRYEPQERRIRDYGFNEAQPLDFHSPYGCSKGAACQYVLDYARTFGLPTVVFRMSCIYGPHQFGTEDQGWVAHFLLRAMQEAPITLYGNGCQVRDLLFIDDLVEAMLLAQQHITRIGGEVFNIGGGPANTLSLLELLELLTTLQGHKPAIRIAPWRAADQIYYVSDTRKFQAATGWRPRTGVRTGIERLYQWLRAQPAPAFHSPLVTYENSAHAGSNADRSRPVPAAAGAHSPARSQTGARAAARLRGVRF